MPDRPPDPESDDPHTRAACRPRPLSSRDVGGSTAASGCAGLWPASLCSPTVGSTGDDADAARVCRARGHAAHAGHPGHTAHARSPRLGGRRAFSLLGGICRLTCYSRWPARSRPAWRAPPRSPPTTDTRRSAWAADHLGVPIPRRACCPGHCAPFDAFADAYFARSPIAVWVPSRGLGRKNVLLATLALTEATTRGAEVRVVGGSTRPGSTASASRSRRRCGRRGGGR